MIHEVYSTNGEIRPEHFSMLYKTIFSYLKDMNLLKEKDEYKDEVAEAKFKQYDYSKNGFLDLKEFSDMLHNDYHCKVWMEALGFKNEEVIVEQRPEKP